MRYHYYGNTYLLDAEHGLGLRCRLLSDSEHSYGFYEDGTLRKETDAPYDSAVNELLRCRGRGWYSRAKEAEHDRLAANGSCVFQPLKEGEIKIILNGKKASYPLKVKKGRYGFDVECGCGSKNCVHPCVAGEICSARIRDLMHAYVLSEEQLDKGQFLDPVLENSIEDGIMEEFGVRDFQKIHDMIRLLDAAKSREYYRQFHEFLLDLYPSGDYDSHFLEQFAYFLFALFEDPGYREAVMADGSYADPSGYEDRQHRSNRAAFKRIYKEYGKTIKELDVKKNFTDDNPYKEFLLKYRRDYHGLLKYYALGMSEDLEEYDIPWLLRIADEPGVDGDLCAGAAEKMDSLGSTPEALPAFRKLLSHLPQEKQVEVYSRITAFSMPMEEVRKLDRHAQKKLIYNMRLTEETFVYILEELLADQSDSEKGQFILAVRGKVIQARDYGLKKTVLEKAGGLRGSRLLYTYLFWLLGKGKPAENKVAAGLPEQELAWYFDCGYTVENEGGSFRVYFSVSLPDDPEEVLLRTCEENGKLSFDVNRVPLLNYSAETVKKVCLAGREEEYRKALEENAEAVEIYRFSQKNHRFVKEYRELCDSLQAEKVLFAEPEKAAVDWLFYHSEGSNALSFRVGNTRKYIVKDAGEFIAAFRSGQTVEYGRDLILSHDPANLQETDAAGIRLLMSARITRGKSDDRKNKRYITVTDSLLGSLIELLKGRTVTYNESPCRIRLERRIVKLRIDGLYRLSMVLEDDEEFLALADRGYLLSRAHGEVVIDRVSAAADEVSLLDFVRKNPSVGIKPILKDFRKNIYSRFFELFDVDDRVSREFRLSEIRLNSYFDYDGGIIRVETKAVRDGSELTEDQLTERVDRNKLELLRNYLSSIGFVDNRLEDDSRVLSFFKMDFSRLKKLTNVYLSESLKQKEVLSVGRPVVRVSYRNNMVRVFLEKSDFSESELEQIIRSLKKKKKYVLLGKDRIVDLDSETARDLCDTVEDFGMDPGNLYRKKTVSMVTAIKAFAHERSCKADKYLRNMIEEIRSFKDAEIQEPSLNGTLRDYQKEGYNWLSILTKYGMGGILADDMGLGKTIQIIALIRADKAKKPSLIVCPKSLVFNWISEFARFDGETQVRQVYGTEPQRAEIISAIDYQEKAVYVTSYESLRNDIDKYTGEFQYGILDEAQFIKNVHALKTKSVKELRAAHRFALTGTPVENSVVDLWSIFDYILPGYFEELPRFKNSDTAVIAKKAAPFILRRVKEDVLEDLPPRYERILSAEMSEGQRKVYDAMRMDARSRLEAGGKAFDLLPYLTRLRQVCVDPAMFLEDYRGGSGKTDALCELIPAYLSAGHRILIFSQFVKALEIVRERMSRLGIPVYFLSGATPGQERIEMMDSFNNGSGTDVFLISLKAGGTGLNLTGADTVIHLDPWWNVAAENQASDRAHRIGQIRNVEVIRLIAEDSIEQRVVELQDMKKDVIRQIISDDDGSVTSASLEDIAFILH